MRISYNKLWKMLIDKGMKKSDLREKSGISSASLAKLGKGENITTDVLLRICEVMDCRIEDMLRQTKMETQLLSSMLVIRIPTKRPNSSLSQRRDNSQATTKIWIRQKYCQKSK